MKKWMVILVIIISCKESQVQKEKKTGTTVYKCTFKGNDKDIESFLVHDELNRETMRMSVLAYLHNFYDDKNSSVAYTMKDSIFETFRLEGTSGQYETDRRYKIKNSEFNGKSMSLILTSGDVYFTRMEGEYLTINCDEIDESTGEILK